MFLTRPSCVAICHGVNYFQTSGRVVIVICLFPILLVSCVPCNLISKWLSGAKVMMDYLPLQGPEVQRIGAGLGDIISKHNCEKHLSKDMSFFVSEHGELRRYREGVADSWLVIGEKKGANKHNSQIQYLWDPAELRWAVSPALACRVSVLFPLVAKLRHP